MRYVALCAVAVLALAGCGKNTKEDLGLEPGAPDEFSVMRRAPLEMPPDYHLRPPAPGAPRPQEPSTVVQAQTIALGGAQPADLPVTSGEQALLREAGAEQRAADIRSEVAVEADQARRNNQATVDKLLGTSFGGEPTTKDALDPVEEAQRLRDEGQL